MQVIEKQAFCFNILNQLLDEFNLNVIDYTKLNGQIWTANTHDEINGILYFLQSELLQCMKDVASRDNPDVIKEPVTKILDTENIKLMRGDEDDEGID